MTEKSILLKRFDSAHALIESLLLECREETKRIESKAAHSGAMVLLCDKFGLSGKEKNHWAGREKSARNALDRSKALENGILCSLSKCLHGATYDSAEPLREFWTRLGTIIHLLTFDSEGDAKRHPVPSNP